MPTALTVFIDQKYLYPAVVMLQSANKHLDPDLNFVIGTFIGELSSQDKAAVTKMFSSTPRKISFIEISKQKLIDEIQHIDTKEHFGHAAFGRLLLQEFIAERHIYSDVDVVFTPGSQKVLREIPGANLPGFVNQAPALARSGLAFDPKNKEFFSGFISWPSREHRPTLALKAQEPWKSRYSTHDQALLNCTLKSNYIELTTDLCQLDNPELRTSNFRPGIVHFFGNWKPWHAKTKSRRACQKADCSWVFWFQQEDDALALANELNLGTWLLSQRERGYAGQSFNLRAMQFLLSSATTIGLDDFFSSLFRKFFGGEYHLVH
jgi:hypothetical protein